jgi:hypothetical protein
VSAHYQRGPGFGGCSGRSTAVDRRTHGRPTGDPRKSPLKLVVSRVTWQTPIGCFCDSDQPEASAEMVHLTFSTNQSRGISCVDSILPQFWFLTYLGKNTKWDLNPPKSALKGLNIQKNSHKRKSEKKFFFCPPSL